MHYKNCFAIHYSCNNGKESKGMSFYSPCACSQCCERFQRVSGRGCITKLQQVVGREELVENLSTKKKNDL